MEGSETGGDGAGDGRWRCMGGGERDGRRVGWDGRRGVGAGREDGGERDGGRMKMEGSETGGAWAGEGRRKGVGVGVEAGEGRLGE